MNIAIASPKKIINVRKINKRKLARTQVSFVSASALSLSVGYKVHVHPLSCAPFRIFALVRLQSIEICFFDHVFILRERTLVCEWKMFCSRFWVRGRKQEKKHPTNKLVCFVLICVRLEFLFSTQMIFRFYALSNNGAGGWRRATGERRKKRAREKTASIMDIQFSSKLEKQNVVSQLFPRIRKF